jgi:hypothetical protein
MLRGISRLGIYADDSFVDRFWAVHRSSASTRRRSMHDLLIALAFIGMVIAPAIVAANSSAESSDDND